MDFKLDNMNLGLNEKNKKLFHDMINQDKPNINDQTSKTGDEEALNSDTFKKYNDFITEKQAIIEIINEICEFSLLTCEKADKDKIKIKNIFNISDLINFKNRVIMIVNKHKINMLFFTYYIMLFLLMKFRLYTKALLVK